MNRFLFGLLVLLFATADAAAADRDPQAIYKRSCTVCHAAGVANAPRTGDAATWQQRLDAKGMDGLVASVRQGLGAMPPGGMCPDCTDGELEAVIMLMAGSK